MVFRSETDSYTHMEIQMEMLIQCTAPLYIVKETIHPKEKKGKKKEKKKQSLVNLDFFSHKASKIVFHQDSSVFIN